MSGNSHSTKPILIIGGTGKTGRRAKEWLTARGSPARMGSRSGKPHALGRSARSFTGYARAAAATGVWGQAETPALLR